jgi:hypothetical protein
MPSIRSTLLPIALVVVTAALPVVTATVATAETEQAGLSWHATVNGRDIATADGNAPIPLHAGRNASVALVVENRGEEAVDVRAIRLDGRVLGLSFFTFSSRIDLAVPPGTTQQRVIDLDLGELGDQATGLIPGVLSLVGPDRQVIADRPLDTDVRGSIFSPYGAFGLIVGGVSLVLALGLLYDVSTGRLPLNRWRRAVRFLAPGLGLGLTATFTLSAVRVLNPSAAAWVPLVLGCGAVAFLLGYLTPQPAPDGPDDDGSREIDVRYDSLPQERSILGG